MYKRVIQFKLAVGGKKDLSFIIFPIDLDILFSVILICELKISWESI